MREAYSFKNACIYNMVLKLMFVRPRTGQRGMVCLVSLPTAARSSSSKILSALNIVSASRSITLLSHDKSKLARERGYVGLMSATTSSQVMAPTDWPVLMIVSLYLEQHALHTSRSHKEHRYSITASNFTGVTNVALEAFHRLYAIQRHSRDPLLPFDTSLRPCHPGITPMFCWVTSGCRILCWVTYIYNPVPARAHV